MSNYSNYNQSTKSPIVYIVMPNRLLIIEATPKRKARGITDKGIIPFKEASSMKFLSFYYKLPANGIALEEYSDYLVVNIGVAASENLFYKAAEIAVGKETGLILKPPVNPSHLYLMDKIVTSHNMLYDLVNIIY
jgi:hypothetical protein